MKIKELKFLLILIICFAFLTNIFSQNETKSLPIEVEYRKSFLKGSYVLQVKNTSNSTLKIWLDAREKISNFSIREGKTKDIGWAQGFRFDANDIFFIGSEGYDTFKGSMPSDELKDFRIGFSKNGALTLNISQSYIQKLLPKYIKLPIKENYPKILKLEINDMPQIILQDRSDRIYANVAMRAKMFSGKVKVPINLTASFVPSYKPSTGAIMASQINVDNLDIKNLPEEWFNDVKNIINNLLTILFSKVQIHQLDKTTLKYCKFFNVRQVNVRKGRLEIELL